MQTRYAKPLSPLQTGFDSCWRPRRSRLPIHVATAQAPPQTPTAGKGSRHRRRVACAAGTAAAGARARRRCRHCLPRNPKGAGVRAPLEGLPPRAGRSHAASAAVEEPALLGSAAARHERGCKAQSLVRAQSRVTAIARPLRAARASAPVQAYGQKAWCRKWRTTSSAERRHDAAVWPVIHPPRHC